MSRLVALAIPFFVLAIGIELLLARRAGKRVYLLPDAVADLGCGIGQQWVLVLMAGPLLAAYLLLYERWRFFTFETGWPVWIVALVGVDFLYYWWHRLSHRVALFWAAHVVHHQSDSFNLAVALRQAIATSVTSLPFFLPLALLGVPPEIYVAANAINTLYQFWIHTELVGKLGAFEWILNTPSHHRVHHGVNPRYLDKNYGGILIVWDRLFGTFAEETERPVYGTVRPFESFNPFWAQLAGWVSLGAKLRQQPRWTVRFASLAMPPGWREEVPREPTPRSPIVRASRGRQLYALAQIALLVGATFALLFEAGTLSFTERSVAVAAGLLSLASLGFLLDGRSWAWRLEASRLVAIVAAVALLG